MGGNVKNDLTADTNVLIVDDYPWPIFNSCLFCLSRLREVGNPCYAKNYITKLIDHFGGKSIASLTPKVTYLITDKREGKRYESALDWKINAIHPKWIIDCCNCQRILDPSLYDISRIHNSAAIGKNSHKKYRKVVDYGSVKNNPLYGSLESEVTRIDRANEITKSSTIEDCKGLFKGLIFSCFGFTASHATKLSTILKENGAEIQEEYDLSVTHVIIPSSFTFDEVPATVLALQNISDSRIVNEWFVERCLHYEKLCNDSWSIPAKKLRLDYKLKIHITGFTEMEHLHISKLIKHLNLTLQTKLTEECDFLVANLSSLGLNDANSPQLFTYKFHDILNSKTDIKTASVSLTKKKINSAKKWNIPVVSLAFIWELAQTGVLPHVLDTQWCIFAPRSLRPASNFLEYARSVSGGLFHKVVEPMNEEADHSEKYSFDLKNSDDDDVDDDDDNNNNNSDKRIRLGAEGSHTKLPVQLPSPRKNAAKKWPKLVGTASESQLKSAAAAAAAAAIDDEEDENYNFKGKRRLVFASDRGSNTKNPQSYVEFEDDFGLEDIPMFKKRKK
ncbi:hypothetical protein PMKS-002778 [Pichia membranifaciens]|uniref:BRCT domain-containing protein n=1 Tax=Pichia membranifaciens TaxID=4926 RepID=A0A1Q2YIB9_9ASCO|nr:hypothetical protein PMKS-002778 [Pichia membranifaciens]